jgi:hypothetical protein
MTMTHNWPVIIASILCIGFIVAVWVNSYRVSHATPPIASIK